MPYIPPEDRVGFEKVETEGELAYAISQLIRSFLAMNGFRFKSAAAVIGVLEAVKLEFYRDKVAPYETQKKKENGDVGW